MVSEKSLFYNSMGLIRFSREPVKAYSGTSKRISDIDTVWYGLIWFDAVWYGLIRFDTLLIRLIRLMRSVDTADTVDTVDTSTI